MIPCIAIFDIGKTNKKFLLFDFNFSIVHEVQTTFEEVKDEDGDNCEDLRSLTNWMLEAWQKIQLNFDFEIKALNFTTYGASFVHLDVNFRPVTPLYNYLKILPKETEEKFYEKYGDKLSFATTTASPALGMLNSGLQLYWLKDKHVQVFEKVEHSLHFPQYCSYLFTKNLCSEFTSIGCHTGLWDFSKNKYHEFVSKEGILDKLAPIATNPKNGETSYRNTSIPVGTGLHDSSAALIPYLQNIKGEFLLLSTGTWCITLNPFAKQVLTEGELTNDCLNFLTFKGNLVKASRLFLGNFHENFTKRFSGKFFKNKDFFKSIHFDQTIFDEVKNYPPLLKDRKNPDILFHFEDLEIYETYEKAYHRLLLDMVIFQLEAIFIAEEGKGNIKKLYVDGGFNKNEIFMYLLKLYLPDYEITAYDISQGTSMGAAMMIKDSIL